MGQANYNFHFSTEQAASEEMKRLRGKLPSGSALLALQNYEAYAGDELGMFIHALYE